MVRRVAKGTLIEPDPSDPRNLSHPIHDDAWMELARVIGRAMGRERYERDHGKPKEASHNLRPVLKRKASKGTVNR
jgi:hypothetical protein